MKTKRNRVRRIRWERLLAVMLCLCMMLSVFEQPAAVKAKNDTTMQIYVYHWHTQAQSRSLQKSGPYIETLSTANIDDKPTQVKAEPNEGEKFTSFSVTAGQDAVTGYKNLTSTDYTNSPPTANVKYTEGIHLVKIHVFYSSSGDEVAGYNLGSLLGDGEEPTPEIDTKIMTQSEYQKLIGSSEPVEPESEIKVYDTSLGLHTDKTASENTEISEEFGDLEIEEGGESAGPRAFDVELESWFADANLADVGLILDASGSMAFASEAGTIVTADKIEAEGDKVRWLSDEQVDEILDKNYTDNSLLNYSDYTYFVFDGRDGTKEYVPLGYWDGGPEETTTEKIDSLQEGQIGHYTIENNFENTAPLKDPKESSVVYNADGSAKLEDTRSCFSSSQDAANKNGSNSLKLYNNGNRSCNVLLDAKLDDTQNFTISFAVRSDKTDNGVKAAGQSLLYIGEVVTDGDILDYVTDNNYWSIARGSSPEGETSGNRIRWYVNANTTTREPVQIVNANNVFDSNHAQKDWMYITYVVKNGETTMYVYNSPNKSEDGKSSSAYQIVYPKNLNEYLVPEGSRIVIGGVDINAIGYGQVGTYIDDIYVYNRALSDGEVEALYQKSNQGTSSETTSTAYIAKDKNGKILAGINEGYATTMPDKASDRAGWYYVNSSSKLQTDELTGTGKEYRGLVKSQYKDDVKNKKTNAYYFYGDKITNSNVTDEDVDHKEAAEKEVDPVAPWADITDTNPYESLYDSEDRLGSSGPCQFYLDSEGRLCCVFSPKDKKYSYSYVYKKEDEDTIKRENLQEALGEFVNKLDQESPESQVAAVRFSTENFSSNGRINQLVMLDWTKEPSESAKILNLERGENNAAFEFESSGGDTPVDQLSDDRRYVCGIRSERI